MANIDRFMIAPLDSMQQDMKPWLLPEQAFAELINAYIFRGRVRKRFGSSVMNKFVADDKQQNYTRLRLQVGTTDAVTGNFHAVMPGAKWKIGQMFSVNDDVFTVYQANGLTYSTSIAEATYDTATGTLDITNNLFNAGLPVYFYPAEPVMGIVQYDALEINNEPTMAFDTQFAYQFNGIAWQRAGTAVWTGTDYQFFWACNWRGVDAQDFILYVVNNNATDGIRYWNAITWTTLTPIVNAGNTLLKSSRIIVPFKGRLLCLNTFEGVGGATAQFTSRCRFSQNGTPLITADVNAWREDIPGKGGFIDAPTKEAIVSCGFIKDRLIVYFERSTWELAYTQNQILPFVWQRINAEIGAESTFSSVPFDKVVLGMGQTGVNACNGANVDRIDQKIPDLVFDISNTDQGVERVCGIRDYFTQMVYWAYPFKYSLEKYPNRLLIYNYLNGAWAIFNDSVTAFGYYQPQNSLTWSSWTTRWDESVAPWDTGEQEAKFRQVLAGNQQGFCFIMNQDYNMNAAVLQISNMVPSTVPGWVRLTVVDHNIFGGLFDLGDYVLVKNAHGIHELNNKIYRIKGRDANTFEVYEPSMTGTYDGAGTISLISVIDIKTKEYNFYIDQGRNAYISKVDFYVDRTDNGQMTVNCFIGHSDKNVTQDGQTTGALMGISGVLETSPYALVPFEAEMDQLWHPIYPQMDGQTIQLQITMNDAQITDTISIYDDFQLHAMTFYATPTSSRLQ